MCIRDSPLGKAAGETCLRIATVCLSNFRKAAMRCALRFFRARPQFAMQCGAADAKRPGGGADIAIRPRHRAQQNGAFGILEPVSYTHLDVYKRQGVLCSVEVDGEVALTDRLQVLR